MTIKEITAWWKVVERAGRRFKPVTAGKPRGSKPQAKASSSSPKPFSSGNSYGWVNTSIICECGYVMFSRFIGELRVHCTNANCRREGIVYKVLPNVKLMEVPDGELNDEDRSEPYVRSGDVPRGNRRIDEPRG